MSSISKGYVKPRIGTFDEDVDPVGFVKLVSAEYAAMQDEYHARLRHFLFRAYTAYEVFRAFPDTFVKLKKDSFWKKSQQKPKDLKTSRCDGVERSCASDKICRDPRRIESRQSEAPRGCGADRGDGRDRGRLRSDACAQAWRCEAESNRVEEEEPGETHARTDVTEDLFDPEEQIERSSLGRIVTAEALRSSCQARNFCSPATQASLTLMWAIASGSAL